MNIYYDKIHEEMQLFGFHFIIVGVAQKALASLSNGEVYQNDRLLQKNSRDQNQQDFKRTEE